MTSDPYPAAVDAPSSGWAPAAQYAVAGAVMPPSPYGYPPQRTGSGATATLCIAAGVLLAVSAVLSLIVGGVNGSASGSAWATLILPAVASTAIAVLLFVPASRPLGQGMAVGYAFWAIPQAFYFAPLVSVTGMKVDEVSVVVAGIAAIVAASGWRRSPRSGTRLIAIIGAAVTAVLAIVGLNIAWFTVTAYNYTYTCCPPYLDRSWLLAGDVFEHVILVGILVWAVIGASSRRSAGQFLGLGVGLGVAVVTTVTVYSSESSVSLNSGLYVMVVAVIVCVATAVVGLVGGGQPVARITPTGPAVISPTMPHPLMPYPDAQAFLATQTNTMAILAIIFAFVFSPLGIVFGHLGRSQIRRTGEQGSGLALAGLILGYIFTSISVLYVLFAVILLTSVAGNG